MRSVPLLPGALFHPGVESPPPATFRGQSREAARVEEDIAKAKADIERAKTEVVAEAARLRKQLDDDTSRWAGTFAGQYAGDSRETSKSHVQDNMVRLTRFAGQTITRCFGLVRFQCRGAQIEQHFR